MKTSLRRAPLALVPLLLLASCATERYDPSDALLAEDPAESVGRRGKAGPSLTFEDQRELGSNSLLAETERLREELTTAEDRIAKQEEELRAKSAEAAKLSSEYAALVRERDDLKRVVEESAAKERALTEQAAAAEIERLRMERQLVEAKLAALVREGK